MPLLRPGAHHTVAPVAAMVGQVAVMAVVAEFVDTDADQALEPALIEVVGDHARDDRAIVCQPSLSRRVIGAKAICWASQITTSSRSRVCAVPDRAYGTGSSLTPHVRHLRRRGSQSIQQWLVPR